MGILNQEGLVDRLDRLERDVKGLTDRHSSLSTKIDHGRDCFNKLLKHLGLQFRYIPPANERYELESIVPKEKV